KKRRVQIARACDRCRLKKSDGSPAPGSKCSHCLASDSTCVFTPGVKQKRAPPKKYVDGLESRLERLEALLSRLHPDSDFSHELEGEPPASAASLSPAQSAHAESSQKRFPHLLFDEAHDVDTTDELFVPSPEPIESEDEDEQIVPDLVTIIAKLRQMNITGPLNRYYGRSSSVRLYATALNVKSELSGVEQDILQEVLANAERRPDFWKLHPWELTRFAREQKWHFVFPEPDLLSRLVSVYFSLTHLLFPILHRPTFEADLADGKHFRDPGFGTIVLLVCSLGARFVDDPRVLLDHPEKPGHPHSAGWMWFNQVQLVRNVALADPTLYDLQALALSIVFLSGMSPPQACWTLAGIGIRLAQDVGAHRRKTFYEHSFEGELWKRAFWALVGLDVVYSSFLGRPCAISLDSFDVEFPIDCDDEYWMNDDPSKVFKQPSGKPTHTSFLVFWIKLQLIHSHALRTIYSLEKHKVIAKIGEQEWEKRVVSELDSALNRWFDALPDHLRWDPTRENEVHFFQSVCLHAAYHLVQMTIHRPFIPSSRKASSLSFPSLTICANSARACIHVLQAHERRIPGAIIMNLLIPAFMAGIVLVLRIWVAKRSGLKIDAEKDMKDVHNAINFIASGEERRVLTLVPLLWPLAGRFKDLLVTLSQVGDLPLPAAPSSSKRTHPDSDD
ncbi:fungal-specific transcription factor domain-containing protein, partial [Vararia minispora EC-137]